MTAALLDTFGRVATDLRVSLTDKCNLRCTYCMPAEGLPWLPSAELLTDDEIVRLVGVAVSLGVRTVRLTGGEPLIRPGLPGLVARLADLAELSLTTNGLGLTRLAQPLADAGLRRVNVSLDSLRADRFLALTRRDRLDEVIAGMAAAAAAGLTPVKVNTVLMRGVNDDEAGELLDWCLERGYELRFIEQMPLDPQHAWDRSSMVTAGRARQRARRGVARRRRPGTGRCRRIGEPSLLRCVRPDPADGRRPAAQLPVRARGVRSAHRASRRGDRCGAGRAHAGGRACQEGRARHR
jgi:cyclic pyranopterin phosphate synthase